MFKSAHAARGDQGSEVAAKFQGDADNDLAVNGADLGVWQGQYGVGLLVVSGELRVEEETGNGGQGGGITELKFDARGISLVVTQRETASDIETVFEDSYVEEVDRAIEQLATVPSGVRSFGQMVARRGVAKPRAAVGGTSS